MRTLIPLLTLTVLFGGCYTQLKTADDKWGYGGTVTKTTETTTTTQVDSLPPQTTTTSTTTTTTTTVEGDVPYMAEPVLTEQSQLADGTVVNNYYYNGYNNGYYPTSYYPSGWWWTPGFSFSIGFGFGYGGYYDPYWGYPYYGYYPYYGGYYGGYYPYYGWGYPPYIPVYYGPGYGYNYPYVGYTGSGQPIKYGRIPGSDRSGGTTKDRVPTPGTTTPFGGGNTLRGKSGSPITNKGITSGSGFAKYNDPSSGTAKAVPSSATGVSVQQKPKSKTVNKNTSGTVTTAPRSTNSQPAVKKSTGDSKASPKVTPSKSPGSSTPTVKSSPKPRSSSVSSPAPRPSGSTGGSSTSRPSSSGGSSSGTGRAGKR